MCPAGKIERMIILRGAGYPDLFYSSRMYNFGRSLSTTYRFGNIVVDKAFDNTQCIVPKDLSFKLSC